MTRERLTMFCSHNVYSRQRTFLVITLCLLAVLPCRALRHDTADTAARNLVAPTRQTPAPRPPSDVQLEAANLARQEGIRIEWNSNRGTPCRVRGKDIARRTTFSGGRGLTVKGAGFLESDAVAVLDNLSSIFGIRDAGTEFLPLGASSDSLGFSRVKLAQIHHGLRVVGGQVIAHFNDKVEAHEVSGSYIPDIEVDVTPAIDATDALAAAQEDLATMGIARGSPNADPELVVFAFQSEPRLAYELTLAAGNALKPGSWRYWIDASDGTVILRFNDIKKISAPTDNGTHVSITGSIITGEGGGATNVTGWLENTGYYYLFNKNLRWYVYNYATSGYTDANTYAYRSSAAWGTSDRTEMSAAVNFDIVQDYFLTIHGRSSYDGSNAYARANVHVGTNYVNAYWDGSAFSFGDGNGLEANSLAVLDVCAHEFTHAITENTANLFYYAEPGALNESFSDIFGVCVEFYGQPDGRHAYPLAIPGHADWLIGEDCWLDGTALRDMRDPSSTTTLAEGYQLPSRYKGTHWYYGQDDNAGVHYNNMPQSFFFYLLCEGGSGTNDGIVYDVSGIGITNAEQIAYRALTVYFAEFTDYSEALGAWLSAAEDLNTNWISSVTQAWAAIGVTDSDVISAELGTALNAPLLTWFTGGATNWFAQTSITHDGVSAAQSGSIAHGLQTRLYTTVTGPGTLYFWWAVSSERNYDFLRFYINDVEQASISGLINWQDAFYSLSEGTHVLKWKYTKDTSMSSGLDAGWLDQVTWIPTFPPSETTAKNDFDGDGKADLAVYHEESGYWFIFLSSSGTMSYSKLGETGYSPVPADYDGDGKADLAVYHEESGYWFIFLSSSGTMSYSKLGEPGYVPAGYR